MMTLFLFACNTPVDDTADESRPTSATCEPSDHASTEVPLKEAKLNIEHNATDADSGFQGFIDSDGWSCLDITGPDGVVLSLAGLGSLAGVGLTELFFESVEPANADVPIEEVLEQLPEGEYLIEGPAMEWSEDLGTARGTALLTHDIPEGPELVAPAEGAEVEAAELLMDWEAVTTTLDGDPVEIIAYQLIVEKVEDPHPHMIGKFGLSMYVGPTITSMTLPSGFLERGVDYAWEVLAIEESGNQTLSSATFSTAP